MEDSLEDPFEHYTVKTSVKGFLRLKSKIIQIYDERSIITPVKNVGQKNPLDY